MNKSRMLYISFLLIVLYGLTYLFGYYISLWIIGEFFDNFWHNNATIILLLFSVPSFLIGYFTISIPLQIAAKLVLALFNPGSQQDLSLFLKQCKISRGKKPINYNKDRIMDITLTFLQLYLLLGLFASLFYFASSKQSHVTSSHKALELLFWIMPAIIFIINLPIFKPYADQYLDKFRRWAEKKAKATQSP